MRRALAAFTTFALVASLLVMGGPGGARGADGPWVVVNPGGGWVQAGGFGSSATVAITRDGEAVTDGAMDDQGDGTLWFQSSEEILAGDEITVTDGTLMNVHTVSGLQVMAINGNIISGTATGPTVHLWVNDTNVDRILPVAGGSWTTDVSVADGSGHSTTLVPGSSGGVDDPAEGDRTQADWSVPNPMFGADPGRDQIGGWEFGGLVTVSIHDPVGAQTETWTADEIEQDGSGSFSLYLDPRHTSHTWDLRPGQTVTVTGGGSTKSLLVADLAMTGYDWELDTISGRAGASPATIYVDVTRESTGGNGPEWSTVLRDVTGAWNLDLRTIDPSFDLQMFDDARAKQPDGDGDETWAYQRIAPPRFAFASELQEVAGYDWPDGSTVTLTVHHPSAPASDDLTLRTTAGIEIAHELHLPSAGGDANVYFNLATAGTGTFRAMAGDTMTMTDGTTSKTQLIPDLRVDHPTGPRVITGSTSVPMPPGSFLWGWPGVTPGSDGTWAFHSGEDIARAGAWAIQIDRDADQTATSEPVARVWVDPQADRVWAIDFEGPAVTLTVTRTGAAPQQRVVQAQNVFYGGWEPVDMWTKPTGDFARPMVALFDLAGDIDLRAGDVLDVADGRNQASRNVVLCSVDSVDAASDTISGQATTGKDVGFHIGDDSAGYWGWSVTPVADHWTYHFDPTVFPNQGLDPGMIGLAFCGDFEAVVHWVVPSGTTTSTTLTGDTPDPTVVGQPYLVTAKVRRTGTGSGRPAGSVTFGDGRGATCTDTTATKVDGRTSSFSCTLRSTAAGGATLTARFDPAAGWAPSSGTTGHAVKRAATSIVVTNAAALALKTTKVGEAYQVAVRVTVQKPGSGTPGGPVSVSDGSASCTVPTLSTTGTGSCSLISTKAGLKTITARYVGTADFGASLTTALHRVR